MNRAERRRRGLTRSRLPRGGRLIAVAVSAAVALAAGVVVAAPARAATPPPDVAFTVGDKPVSIAVNPAGTIAVTVNADDNTASVIDLGTGDDSTVVLGYQDNYLPRDVAIDPSGTYAYVTNYASKSVSRINLRTLDDTSIPVGDHPNRIVIDPAGMYAYVTVGGFSNPIKSADRITLSDLTVTAPTPPFLSQVTGPLLITSDGSTIYSYSADLRRYTASTGAIDDSFSTGAGSVTGAGFNGDQTAIYGVDDNGRVSKTQLAGRTTQVWVSGPGGGDSLSWASAGNYAYVPKANDGKLTRINLRVPQAATAFATGLSSPHDVAVPFDGTFVLVAVAGADQVFKYTLPPPPAPPTPPGEGSRALVWGYGGDGALGTGSTSSEFAPVQMAGGANTVNAWGMNWYSMDGGWDQTCGVGTDQRAYCWGLNGSGQLGDGTVDDTNVPVAVAPGANTGNAWVSVSAGSDYSTCGIGIDAKAYCWGENADGRLGDGTTDDTNVPVAVIGGPTFWSSVRVGNTHACGVGNDEEAYCWGKNVSGALGDGTTVNSPVPVQVVGGPQRWAEVSAGFDHTCGIGTDRRAYCWGNNDDGELGDGSTDDTAVPVQVQAGDNVSGNWDSIVTGYDATCAIGSDGQAYCWGWDKSGQLGNGVAGNQVQPVRVELPMGVSVRILSMDAYGEHVCAVSTGNIVYCWGYNGEGQLGNGATSNSDVPVAADLNAFPSANLAAGTPRMVAVGSRISLMVSSFGAAPVFTAASPPSTGIVGTAYSTYSFSASGTTPITFTQANGTLPPGLTLASNGVLSGTPTTPGTYTFTVTASNGVNPDATTSPVTIEVAGTPTPDPNPPAPAPATPSSAPRDVRATAAIKSADVSWLPPTSPGTFPVTSYQAVANPGGQACLVVAPALTCTITGLTPGESYTVTARALTAAGWSEPSPPSQVVVPLSPPTPNPTATILITSSRDRAQKSMVRVEGATTGLVGARVVPFLRVAGHKAFTPGASSRTVNSDGTFVWQRKAKKRFTVYFASGDVTSNRLVIRPE